MPTPLPLTSERLERHGLFLIEDGQTIFLWVGRDAVPQLVMDVFNLPSYELLRGGKVSDMFLFMFGRTTVVDHSILLILAARRRHFRSSTTRSHSESMRSSKRHVRCAGGFIIRIYTSSKRMASLHYVSGHSAASFKIAQMCYPVISSSLRSSRTR
jgi:hypothetical protein